MNKSDEQRCITSVPLQINNKYSLFRQSQIPEYVFYTMTTHVLLERLTHLIMCYASITSFRTVIRIAGYTE